MVTLKEACKEVTSKHPKEYIAIVSELENVYAFTLLNKGEKIENCTFLPWLTIVDKMDGTVTDGILISEEPVANEIIRGDYKKYTTQDLEKLHCNIGEKGG